MDFLYYLNGIIVILLTVLLLFPFLINILSLLKKQGHLLKTSKKEELDIACVITAYDNLDLALLASTSLLQQNYSNYHVYIIADECEIPTDFVPNPKMNIVKPPVKLGSKVKSMNFAIENFIRSHDAIAIFDPDNLADENFLLECNKFLSNGYKAVQGKRVAKNLDTKIACLDAMGEIYYNFTTKKTPFNLGSSAIIAGSGMVIETELFKGFFEVPYIKKNYQGVIPGEDKILHYYIVSQDQRIAFADHALLYDEKVSNAKMVKNQRTRWINSYILNLSNALELFIKGLTTLNMNKLLSGALTLYPPLFILIISSFLLMGLNLFISPVFSLLLMVGCIIFVLNFVLVLKITHAHKKIWAAFWSIPQFMMNQILALVNIKKSNKEFLTTKNEKKMSLEDVIKNS